MEVAIILTGFTVMTQNLEWLIHLKHGYECRQHPPAQDQYAN